MTATQQLDRTTASTVTQVPLPADARALSTLDRIDYADAFAVETGVDRTAEEWIRAVLLDAPLRVRARLFIGWTALGLALGPPWSSGRPLGWKVHRRGPGFVLLSATSWLGLRGELLFRTESETLLFSTLIRLNNPVARRVWASITDTHQQVVRSLLTHAARREADR